MKKAQTLICTVGTSLFFPNLHGLKVDDVDADRRALAMAYSGRNWGAIAVSLGELSTFDRLCGAEINSLASLLAKEYADPGANLYFVHSATDDGRAIAEVLKRYYQLAHHPVVEVREVDDLQDSDPKRFRTKGLRNLAKVVCKIIRDHGPGSCGINATGGYKAQIAIAVLMGQAVGVPVYYKHERFDEIIAFPPMPVALNFDAWMRISGLLFALERHGMAPNTVLEDVGDDAEIAESLIERTVVDDNEYIDLSPTGQIFHETFRERFRSGSDEVLPPQVSAAQKQSPHLEASGTLLSHSEIRRYLESVTREVPQVRRCGTHYFNPDLPEQTRFRLGPKGIEGIFSNGTYTVRFWVDSSANTEGQKAAVVAALNEWFEKSSH